MQATKQDRYRKRTEITSRKRLKIKMGEALSDFEERIQWQRMVLKNQCEQ
jgi:hypothetical protein